RMHRLSRVKPERSLTARHHDANITLLKMRLLKSTRDLLREDFFAYRQLNEHALSAIFQSRKMLLERKGCAPVGSERFKNRIPIKKTTVEHTDRSVFLLFPFPIDPNLRTFRRRRLLVGRHLVDSGEVT